MSHVLVPMILTSVPGLTPEPTAPMWASNAPTATGMPAGRPTFLRHLGRQLAGFLIGGDGAVRVVLGDLGQVRIQPPEERLAGQTAPILVVHRLVAGRADAARHRIGIGLAREKGRDEVGQLDPGVGRVEDLRSRPPAVQDLGPVPLAGIDAAALGQVAVFRAAPPWP